MQVKSEFRSGNYTHCLLNQRKADNITLAIIVKIERLSADGLFKLVHMMAAGSPSSFSCMQL